MHSLFLDQFYLMWLSMGDKVTNNWPSLNLPSFRSHQFAHLWSTLNDTDYVALNERKSEWKTRLLKTLQCLYCLLQMLSYHIFEIMILATHVCGIRATFIFLLYPFLCSLTKANLCQRSKKKLCNFIQAFLFIFSHFNVSLLQFFFPCKT